jgi:tetratricopeptide (TPR) repeat protein
MDRLEALRSIVAGDPRNTLARYGLAMEYANHGDYERAVAEYESLLEINPDYCYAYYQAAQTLEKMGRLEDARSMYSRGIEASGRSGDEHARGELQTALDLLG